MHASADEQNFACRTLRAQLQRQVEMIVQWANIENLPGGCQANILLEGKAEQMQNEQWGNDDAGYAAWKGKGKGKGKDWKGKGKGKDAGAKVCIDCGGKDHTISECKKTLVPINEKPCLRCLKPGRIAWCCAEKCKPANAVAEDNETGRTIMLAYEEGYPQVDMNGSRRRRDQTLRICSYSGPCQQPCCEALATMAEECCKSSSPCRWPKGGEGKIQNRFSALREETSEEHSSSNGSFAITTTQASSQPSIAKSAEMLHIHFLESACPFINVVNIPEFTGFPIVLDSKGLRITSSTMPTILAT